MRVPGFGGTSQRFDYVPKKRKQGMMPSPFSYNGLNLVDRTGNGFTSNISKSLGVSRKNMNPEFIDKIILKELDDGGNPAPGHNHNNLEWLHNQSHSTREKAAPLFSMPPRDDHLHLHLAKLGCEPGPGSYGAPMVHAQPKTKHFAPVRSMMKNASGITWMEDGRGNEES